MDERGRTPRRPSHAHQAGVTTLWDRPSLDDLIEQQLKEAGQDWAAMASAHWQAVARKWLEQVPIGTELTSDDVTDAVGVPTSQGAVGAFFSAARNKKQIVTVGLDISHREGRHGSTVRVWRKI